MRFRLKLKFPAGSPRLACPSKFAKVSPVQTLPGGKLAAYRGDSIRRVNSDFVSRAIGNGTTQRGNQASR